MRRLKLLLSYDGGGFRGFADNPGIRSVEGELKKALKRYLGHEAVLACAGRTDAGVHALGQVASLDVSAETDLDGLRHSLNSQCGPEIFIRQAKWAKPDFDARHSSLSRKYVYTILNQPEAHPLIRNESWHIAQELNVENMSQASECLLGRHDFSSFCRQLDKKNPKSLVRDVLSAEWKKAESHHHVRLLRFEIEASSFCQQMVRSIVGAQTDIGRGKFPPKEMQDILNARSRHSVKTVAPPQGLCLHEVRLEEDESF